jgi:cytochrome c
MSDLQVNKILGAALATGLVILGLKSVSELIFHTEAPEKPGYAVAIQEEAAGGGEAAEVPPDWGTVLASADVAAGQTVSAKCASCHTFTAGGANTIGPNLYGVVARKPGSHAGFAYSPAMTAFGDKQPSWDYEHLYEYLKAPQGYVQGTKMTFVGLKKQDERINLIAWLRTQAASPAPIPAPNPAAAAPAAPAAGAAPAAEGAAPAAANAAAPAAAGAPAAAPAPAAPAAAAAGH